jgi:PPP family 3-phenylpropionic acid transporter
LIRSRALPFIFFYALIYMSMATFHTYINIYYRQIGYGNSQIGLLASVGSITGLFAMPFWGQVADRTDKRRVLFIVTGCAAASTLLFPLSLVFIFICAATFVFTAFNSAVAPLGDAITLQYVNDSSTVKFSSIRLVGTISYALMVAVMGRLLTGDVGRIFYVSAFILAIAFVMIKWMPPSGQASSIQKEKHADIRQLFKNKTLVIIFLVAMVHGVIMTFYHSFIGLLVTEMGAGTGQVGIATSISAICEIPVLFFTDKWFGKRKPVYVLIFVGIAVALRMFLLYAGGSVYTVYAASVLHGFNYILPYYFIVTLIDRYAPENLKATAQAVCSVCRYSVAALIGNLGGGYLADMFNLRQVFLLLSVMSFILLTVVPSICMLIFKFKERKDKA